MTSRKQDKTIESARRDLARKVVSRLLPGKRTRNGVSIPYVRNLACEGKFWRLILAIKRFDDVEEMGARLSSLNALADYLGETYDAKLSALLVRKLMDTGLNGTRFPDEAIGIILAPLVDAPRAITQSEVDCLYSHGLVWDQDILVDKLVDRSVAPSIDCEQNLHALCEVLQHPDRLRADLAAFSPVWQAIRTREALESAKDRMNLEVAPSTVNGL